MRLALRNAVAESIVDALARPAHVASLDAVRAALEPDGAWLSASAAAPLLASAAFVAAETTAGAAADRRGPSSARAGKGSAARNDDLARVRVALRADLEGERAAARARVARARAVVDAYWRGRQPADALDAALAQSALLFASGLFFEVHEILETAWNRQGGEVRVFVQGLIQIAVALHHLEHGNAGGACSLFAAGRAKLESHRPSYRGVAVAGLLAGLVPWEAAAAAGAEWPTGTALPPFVVA